MVSERGRLDSTRALDRGENPAWMTNPGYALSERARWENAFHDELTATFAADPPASLLAAGMPPRLAAKATAVLAGLTGALPRWAADFVRRRQFAVPVEPGDEPVSTLVVHHVEPTAAQIADALAPTLATAAFANHVLTLLAARGIEYKAWVTRHDPKVRTSHREADGQVVRLSAPFVVGGYLLQTPADSRTAPIEQWINCRCVIIAGHGPARPGG